MALEWIRANIEGFGGDKARITIFGQSAGGAMVDYYSYGWASDPIANGFIPMSGVAAGFGTPSNRTVTQKWFNLTAALGCGGASDSNAAYQCMLTKPAPDIIAAIPASDTGLADAGGLAYAPVADNIHVWDDYSLPRSAPGGYLIGNANNEAGLFRLRSPDAPEVIWITTNQASFTCPAEKRASRAVAGGHPTWRYRYFGDFPNMVLTTTPPSGAWHASDVSRVLPLR
jgi:carboxylesterase type B